MPFLQNEEIELPRLLMLRKKLSSRSNWLPLLTGDSRLSKPCTSTTREKTYEMSTFPRVPAEITHESRIIHAKNTVKIWHDIPYSNACFSGYFHVIVISHENNDTINFHGLFQRVPWETLTFHVNLFKTIIW